MAQFLAGRLNEFSIEEVRGTRCRLQRLRDLKFLAGWVRDVSARQLKVELKANAGVEVGDKFNVEASIEKATVGLPCEVTAVNGDHISLLITGEPRLTTPGQEARYRADGVSATLNAGGNEVEVNAIDVSMNGLAVLSLDQLPRFHRIRLHVRGCGTAVECSGVVKYCRAESGKDDAFRVGFELEFDDRLSKMMWQRLVQATAHAPAKAA